MMSCDHVLKQEWDANKDEDLQEMFAIAETMVFLHSATKSGHEVQLASAVNAMTYAFILEI